jgi:hypothetical protein
MAQYKNKNGEVIETQGHIYCVYNANGELVKTTDVSKWSSSAEIWIDNDIKDQYWVGFRKVSA